MEDLWIDPSNGELVHRGPNPPKGAKEVSYRPGRDMLPVQKSDIPWLRIAMAGGTGLLAHTIASTIMDRKRKKDVKESAWNKVLRALIPLGAAAAGTYGGSVLGDMLNKSAQARKLYRLNEDLFDEYNDNTKKNVTAAILGAGGAGSGYASYRLGRGWWKRRSDLNDAIKDLDIAKSLRDKDISIGDALKKHVEDLAETDVRIKNIGRKKPLTGTDLMDALDLARTRSALSHKISVGKEVGKSEKAIEALEKKISSLRTGKAKFGRWAARTGGGSALAFLSALALGAKSYSNSRKAARIREALDALK